MNKLKFQNSLEEPNSRRFYHKPKQHCHAITYQGSVACTSLVSCYLEIMCVRSLMLSIG